MTVECTSHHQGHIQGKAYGSNATFFDRLVLALKDISATWQTYRKHKKQRAKDRKAINSLEQLDDKSLRDIGISRDDLFWAASLPAHINASKALNDIRSENIATARWKAMHKEIRRRN